MVIPYNRVYCHHQCKAETHLTGHYLFLPAPYLSLPPCPVHYNGYTYRPYPLWLPTSQLAPYPSPSSMQNPSLEAELPLTADEEKADPIVTAEEASLLPGEEVDPIVTAEEEETSHLPMEEIETPLPVNQEEAPIEEAELPLPPNKIEPFVLQMSADDLYINGICVLTIKAKQLFALMKILIQQYLLDLEAGRSSENYTLLDLATLACRLQDSPQDDDTIRSYLQRLQNKISQSFKERLNQSIADNLIIEAVLLEGSRKRYGYRINPDVVRIVPFILPKA